MPLLVLPKSLVAHTPATAADVMADFNAIASRINGELSAENLASSVRQSLFESGDLKFTARSGAPSGWLMCEGQAVSRATYSALFAAIGTAYGAGDGVTTFNVPDLRGRVPVGVDGAAGRLNSEQFKGKTGRGGAGGSQFVQQHQHSGEGLVTTANSPPHDHSFPWQAALNNLGGPSVANIVVAGGSSASSEENVTHTHNVVGSTALAGGGDQQNMPPFQVGNWMVKT